MNEMQMKYDGDESYDNAATRLRSLFRRYCTTLRDGLQGHFLRNRAIAERHRNAAPEHQVGSPSELRRDACLFADYR